MKRVLFILKQREVYWGEGVPGSNVYPVSSGLSNSVRFVVHMLNQNGIQAKMVEVIDNNSIDREVTAYKPTHVVIEAFWVVPEKFDVLKPLHPSVQWIVRNHSETPFLANEGIAFEWIYGYVHRNIEVASNSPRAQYDIATALASWKLSTLFSTYLPNVYPIPNSTYIEPHLNQDNATVNVGCFGAIRPLKNQLAQALAAISFGDSVNRKINFHINGTRIEGNGDPILKNLRALFTDTHSHTLTEHTWLNHKNFLALMRTMDFSLQASYTETFNIVSADAMAESVPIIGYDIPWLGDYAQVDDVNDTTEITTKMIEIWNESDFAFNTRLHSQRNDLLAYVQSSSNAWLDRFN